MKISLSIAAGALLFALAPFAASAATINSDMACDLGDVTMDGASAEQCFGKTTNSNNDNLADFNNDEFVAEEPIDSPGMGLFGYQDWAFLAKDEDTGPTGSISLDVDDGEGGSAWSANAGDWTSGDLSLFDHVVVVVKTSNSWAAYLFTGDAIADFGTWTTAAFPTNNEGSRALSHLSLYGGCSDPDGCDGGGDNPNGEIPLPAAGWMLLAGVGGLAAMRRRKKA